MAFSRRELLWRAGVIGLASFAPLQMLSARSAAGKSVFTERYGPLQPDPNGLLDLPKGFRYVAFSRTGDIMSDGNPVPDAHDGMAAFPGPRGTTILVRNHELSPGSATKVIVPADKVYDPLCTGGTTTLVVGRNRQLLRDYATLSGTYRNCAGGLTPWGSWISSEENTNSPLSGSTNVSVPHGYNFEVPALATGPVAPVPLVAMGRFNHEAVAVDPNTGIVYETEDRGDGLFYRFIPNTPGVLVNGGTLEALRIKGQSQAITKSGFPLNTPVEVEWVKIDEPDPVSDTVRVEGFGKGAAQFSRGEGIWYGNGVVWFTCTNGGAAGLGQVWRLVPGVNGASDTLELFYESTDASVLEAPDNLTVTPFGDIFLMEDGDGDQFVVGITPEGTAYQFARNALNDREFAGGCFSPDGRTFFLNIYSPGITFAIWGPWERQA